MGEAVSGDEIASQVYNEQGFLVMTMHAYCQRGSIHRCDYYEEDTRTALRCIGPSTHAEFARQIVRMNELSGNPHDSSHVEGARYYRMEPVD